MEAALAEAPGAAPEQEASEDLALYPIRQDVRLMPGTRAWNGEPTWTLTDPIRNRFFQISDADMRLLQHWQLGSQSLLIERLAEAGVAVTPDEVEDFQQFLLSSELVDTQALPLRVRLTQMHNARSQTIWQQLLHKYLFFRVPLVRPDRFLDALYPRVRFLFQPWVPRLAMIMGMLGIFLVIQNWERFAGGFSWLVTPAGLLVFGLTLAAVKVLHELGHALMCKHFGLRVPTMGVAFLVMWPVLYTDASESWRLTSRRQRALIGAAGVMTELMLAAFAMVLWFFLPDGLLRGVAFTVATTTWVLSVIVNLNPLMRFDGYYFLSDLVNIPNLQDRSFVVAKWRLRQWLFNATIPAPESFSPRILFWMLVYAWAILIYRFFLFLGIAVLVYYLFFKALGIFLFLVEISWFIVRPIWNEIKHWRELYPGASLPRRRLYQGLALVLLLLLAFPWRSSVELPALLSAQQHARMYLPVNARVQTVNVRDGALVKQGDVLMQLESPELAFQLQLITAEVTRLENLLAGVSVNEDLYRDRLVLEQELAKANTLRHGLERELDMLTVRAPFAGQVRDLEPDLMVGQWLGATQHLLTVIPASGAEVVAWVTEQDRDRIQQNATGYFWSEVARGPLGVSVQVQGVDTSAVRTLEPPFHAAEFGGDIVVSHQAKDAWVPRQALYKVRLKVQGDEVASQRWRGHVVVEGKRRSLLASGATWLLGALIRESGL